MTEMNGTIETMENGNAMDNTNPASDSGTDMVVGSGLGAALGGFVGSKMGYGKAIRDAAKATGVDPKKLLADIKAEKKKDKPKKGKIHWRNPFYREEVATDNADKEPKSEKKGNVEEEEKKPVPAKKTRKSK